MMTLQQFRVLLAVREAGSLTRAADALHYGVPTVTHHLRGLEAHLRVRLVEPSRSGTRLTPLGESFAEEIALVLARIDRAEQTVADQRDAGVVTLRVGTFASIGSRLLPAAIAQLQQRTSVRVEVIEAEPTDVVRMIRSGEVHAGLIYDVSDEPAFVAPDLTLETLIAEPYRVMVARDSEWAGREFVDFTELSEVAWVCSRSGGARVCAEHRRGGRYRLRGGAAARRARFRGAARLVCHAAGCRAAGGDVAWGDFAWDRR